VKSVVITKAISVAGIALAASGSKSHPCHFPLELPSSGLTTQGSGEQFALAAVLETYPRQAYLDSQITEPTVTVPLAVPAVVSVNGPVLGLPSPSFVKSKVSVTATLPGRRQATHLQSKGLVFQVCRFCRSNPSPSPPPPLLEQPNMVNDP
jgi:hypothetical protein